MENMINFYNICRSPQLDKSNIYFSDLSRMTNGIVKVNEKYNNNDENLKIVIRDDVIQYGTKSRFSDAIIEQLIKEFEPQVFVYLSDVFDSTQMAISSSCHKFNKKLIIYSTTTSRLNNAYSEISKTFDTTEYKYYNTLDEAEKYLNDYLNEMNHSYRIPDGLEHKIYIDGIIQLCDLIYDYFGTFEEVWCTIESSVTLQGLSQSKIGETYFALAVKKQVPRVGQNKLIYSNVDYEKSCVPYIPPYPSNMFTDAKIYQYVKDRKGKILIWNKI
jgi:hypothetical protein